MPKIKKLLISRIVGGNTTSMYFEPHKQGKVEIEGESPLKVGFVPIFVIYYNGERKGQFFSRPEAETFFDYLCFNNNEVKYERIEEKQEQLF
jgi:hypothetical protein